MTDLTIIPENIRLLGPIYEAAMLDEMRAYDVADRLLELQQEGLLPVGRARAGEALFRHWKRSSSIVPKAERWRLFSQAFGYTVGGDARTVPNRDFNDMWMRFVAAVSAFARQLTMDPLHPKASHLISQEQVRKAARDLPANLSLHSFGAATFAAAELQHQMEDLIKMLRDPEIRRVYGARDVTQLVERVLELELGGCRSGATISPAPSPARPYWRGSRGDRRHWRPRATCWMSRTSRAGRATPS